MGIYCACNHLRSKRVTIISMNRFSPFIKKSFSLEMQLPDDILGKCALNLFQVIMNLSEINLSLQCLFELIICTGNSPSEFRVFLVFTMFKSLEILQMEDCESGSDNEILEDDFQPVTSLRRFGRPGTKHAAVNWFRETQTEYVIDQNQNRFAEWFHGIISRK